MWNDTFIGKITTKDPRTLSMIFTGKNKAFKNLVILKKKVIRDKNEENRALCSSLDTLGNIRKIG